jgi:hypothetical protein
VRDAIAQSGDRTIGVYHEVLLPDGEGNSATLVFKKLNMYLSKVQGLNKFHFKVIG